MAKSLRDGEAVIMAFNILKVILYPVFVFCMITSIHYDWWFSTFVGAVGFSSIAYPKDKFEEYVGIKQYVFLVAMPVIWFVFAVIDISVWNH